MFVYAMALLALVLGALLIILDPPDPKLTLFLGGATCLLAAGVGLEQYRHGVKLTRLSWLLVGFAVLAGLAWLKGMF